VRHQVVQFAGDAEPFGGEPGMTASVRARAAIRVGRFLVATMKPRAMSTAT